MDDFRMLSAFFALSISVFSTMNKTLQFRRKWKTIVKHDLRLRPEKKGYKESIHLTNIWIFSSAIVDQTISKKVYAMGWGHLFRNGSKSPYERPKPLYTLPICKPKLWMKTYCVVNLQNKQAWWSGYYFKKRNMVQAIPSL